MSEIFKNAFSGVPEDKSYLIFEISLANLGPLDGLLKVHSQISIIKFTYIRANRSGNSYTKLGPANLV